MLMEFRKYIYRHILFYFYLHKLGGKIFIVNKLMQLTKIEFTFQ